MHNEIDVKHEVVDKVRVLVGDKVEYEVLGKVWDDVGCEVKLELIDEN